jgi:hypothetical protein
MRRTVAVPILIVLSLAIGPTPLAKGEEPLDRIELLGLALGGDPSQYLAWLVMQRGITWKPDKEYLTTLQYAGANGAFLKALRSAKRIKPRKVEQTIASKERERW